MGRSDKPGIDYTFQSHYAYLEAFIEEMGLTNVTLALHDWGAALGFEYARQHPDNVPGIAFIEGALLPVFPAILAELSRAFQDFFNLMRDPVQGPEFIIEQMDLSSRLFLFWLIVRYQCWKWITIARRLS